MTNELTTQELQQLREKVKSLPELPVQVRTHFKDLDEAQELKLKLIYAGTKELPNFFEWVESHQANTLFKRYLSGDKRLDLIDKAIKEHQKKKSSMESSEWTKEATRLEKMYSRITEEWLMVQKELRVLTQTNLNRETPKKLEVTQVRVTPTDVANLIDQARKVVDVESERVEKKTKERTNS